MKDYCLELVGKQVEMGTKYNIMREYVQAYVLKIMQDAGRFRHYAFVGGTALRFLYDLPRFSEDLDFSLIDPATFTFAELMGKIKRDLAAAGYQVGITYNDEKSVHSAFIKFEELLFEAGLSPMKTQKFSIKLEVDTRPPDGAVVTTRIVNKFFPLSFQTYDLPSLFAGKVHAILSRKFVKGRDYYDVAWYLLRHKGLVPNMSMLAAALLQTHWSGETITRDNWRIILAARIRETDWAIVDRDVARFLERPEDLAVLTRDNILQLVDGDVD